MYICYCMVHVRSITLNDYLRHYVKANRHSHTRNIWCTPDLVHTRSGAHPMHTPGTPPYTHAYTHMRTTRVQWGQPGRGTSHVYIYSWCDHRLIQIYVRDGKREGVPTRAVVSRFCSRSLNMAFCMDISGTGTVYELRIMMEARSRRLSSSLPPMKYSRDRLEAAPSSAVHIHQSHWLQSIRGIPDDLRLE